MRPAVVAAVVALATTAVFPHDYWLEPSTFVPAPGEVVKIRMMVGEHLDGESVPRDDSRIERFAAAGAAADLPVSGSTARIPRDSSAFRAPTGSRSCTGADGLRSRSSPPSSRRT